MFFAKDETLAQQRTLEETTVTDEQSIFIFVSESVYCSRRFFPYQERASEGDSVDQTWRTQRTDD